MKSVCFVEGVLRAALEYARDPWFPSTSTALGNLSAWFIRFSAWMGIRLGIVEYPLRRLVLRRNRVQWSKLPAWIRMGAGLVIGATAFITLGAMTKLSEGEKS